MPTNPLEAAQSIEVLDIQRVCSQLLPSILVIEENVCVPRFCPNMVKLVEPEAGALAQKILLALLTHMENAAVRDPMRTLMLIETRRLARMPRAGRQTILVSDNHHDASAPEIDARVVLVCDKTPICAP